MTDLKTTANTIRNLAGKELIAWFKVSGLYRGEYAILADGFENLQEMISLYGEDQTEEETQKTGDAHEIYWTDKKEKENRISLENALILQAEATTVLATAIQESVSHLGDCILGGCKELSSEKKKKLAPLTDRDAIKQSREIILKVLAEGECLLTEIKQHKVTLYDIDMEQGDDPRWIHAKNLETGKKKRLTVANIVQIQGSDGEALRRNKEGDGEE